MQLPIRLASDTAALPRRMLHLPFQSDGDRLAKSSALNQSVSRRTGNSGWRRRTRPRPSYVESSSAASRCWRRTCFRSPIPSADC